MTSSPVKKISALSRTLKHTCSIAIILFPIFNLLYWLLDLSKIRFLAIDNWYIQLSDTPHVLDRHLSLKMKLIGFSIDLIPCFFLILFLSFLAKLFKQYENLYFFSKKNAHYLYWTALSMFCNGLVYPFYLVLRNHVFTPAGQGYTMNLFAPASFKAVIISFTLLLFAYITEAAHHFEEELIGTV